jgi:hypothetical protein
VSLLSKVQVLSFASTLGRLLLVDTVKPDQPAFDFVDTGLPDNDGITSNGVITVSNLEAGITWGFSTNGGTSESVTLPLLPERLTVTV